MSRETTGFMGARLSQARPHAHAGEGGQSKVVQSSVRCPPASACNSTTILEVAQVCNSSVTQRPRTDPDSDKSHRAQSPSWWAGEVC